MGRFGSFDLPNVKPNLKVFSNREILYMKYRLFSSRDPLILKKRFFIFMDVLFDRFVVNGNNFLNALGFLLGSQL